MKYMLIVVSLVVSVVAGAQQSETNKKLDVRPFATASFGLYSNMGYKAPSYLGGGAGVEIRKWGFLTISSLGLSSTPKQQTTGGYSIDLGSDTYVQLKNFLIGGGVSWVRLSTDQWSKSAMHPEVSAGFYSHHTRALVHYITAGSDKLNAVHGCSVSWEVPINRMFYVVESFGLLRSHATGDSHSPTRWGKTFGISLKLMK